MTLSLTLATLCSFLLYFNADFLAAVVIKEPRCSILLKLISVVFPFCSITSCINGVYYGLKKTNVPAVTQLIEQITRIIFSYLYIWYISPKKEDLSCEFAVLAIVIGETTSMIYNLVSLYFTKFHKEGLSSENHNLYHRLLIFAIPYTTTHLITSILHSLESILIPNMLKISGMTQKGSLSIYGILTGMSMSLLMFPSTITNSLSVLLLPSVSEAKSSKNDSYISRATENSIKYSLLIGLFCTATFLLFGTDFGMFFFSNELSGTFLRNLSLLCPFLYLCTTLTSILNGIGKIHVTFKNTVFSLSLRVFLLLFLIPKYGIIGYFMALLFSQLLLTFLNIYCCKKYISFSFPTDKWIIFPSLILTFFGFFIRKIYILLLNHSSYNPIIPLGSCCMIYIIIYLSILYIKKIL